MTVVINPMITMVTVVIKPMLNVVIAFEAVFRWWRSNKSGRFTEIRFFLCLVFEDIRRKGSSITDSIAVSEMSVVPLLLTWWCKVHMMLMIIRNSHHTHPRSTVTKLRAAGCVVGAALGPVNMDCPEGVGGTAAHALPCAQQVAGARGQEGQH